MRRRRKEGYFKSVEGAPQPLVVEVKRRVRFSEVDLMGIVWHGRYPVFFEEAAEELGRRIGLSYKEFYEAKLRAPIVQFHIDYHSPLLLGDEFTARASIIWAEGARLNTEFALVKQDGTIAATGYMVQMFVEGDSMEVCIVCPELVERSKERWKAGEFDCLK